MWRKLRIVILLFILATVAHRAWLQEQHLQWKDTLYVAVYPVNAGNQSQVAEYIASLEAGQFGLIADFLAEEAERYQLNVRRPFEFKLGPPVIELPPRPPQKEEVPCKPFHGACVSAGGPGITVHLFPCQQISSYTCFIMTPVSTRLCRTQPR